MKKTPGKSSKRSSRKKQSSRELMVAQRWETVSLEGLIARFDEMAERAQKFNPATSIVESTWVYSAITFIAEHVKRTPLIVYNQNGEKVESHEIMRFINNPCDRDDQDTSGKFRYAYMVELLLNGSVMRVFTDMEGFKPTRMVVSPRWKFIAQVAEDSIGDQEVVSWQRLTSSGRKTFVPGIEIFHDALYNPLHDFEGLAPLRAAALSVLNDRDVSAFAQSFFQNDGSTGIVFSTDDKAFKMKQADQTAEAWNSKWNGVKNAHKAKFVGFGLKPYHIGTPLDAKMLEVIRSFTKEEIISGIYKIPLAAITASDGGGGDIVIGGPSGGSTASANESFLINVVMPWADRYDEDFKKDVSWRFDPGIRVAHDFSGNQVLERRRLERAKVATELADRGVPLNEVIRWMKMDIRQQPHGDDWWIKSDRLPARIVMDAGDDAIKIAIPEVPSQGASSDQILESYVDDIMRLAQTVSVRNSNGRIGEVSNRDRLKFLLRDGRFGSPAVMEARNGQVTAGWGKKDEK